MVFITFEGPEGSGKTTHIKLLAEYLESKGRKVVVTKEHTGKNIAKILVEYLKKDMPMVDALLYCADRAEHVEELITPALKEGKDVLCDRYYHSTLVLQAAQGLDFNWLLELNKFFPKTDLTIIIDVSPETSLKRMEENRSRDVKKFDKKEFLKKTRQNYLDLPKKLKDNFAIINGEKQIEDVQKDIRKIVDRFLERYG